MKRFAGVDRTVTFDGFAPWQRCTACSGGPAPGARALMAYWLETVPGVCRSLGIYNCRPVRGSTSLSMHSCGRAVDLGVPVSAAGHDAAYEFLRLISGDARRLGIQYLVFNRTQWSARRMPAGEPYRGVHPHYDHIHAELNVAAARKLTLATLRATLDREQEPDVYVVRYGQSDDRVRRAQAVVRAAGIAAGMGDLLPRFGADGDYGDETAAAVDRIAGRIGPGFPQAGKVGLDVLVLDYCRNWLSD
ncbi:MAG: hypothetical protein ABR616_10305 [Dermatophilaceae bacterium]